MLICGKMDKDTLPVGEVRKSLLGFPIALVKEYHYWNTQQASALPHSLTGEGVVVADIQLDRELPEDSIKMDDRLYIILAAAPRVSIRLDSAIVTNVYTEDHLLVEVPEYDMHPLTGDSAGQASFVEHMETAKKMAVDDREMRIFHSYDALRRGPYGRDGKSHDDAARITADDLCTDVKTVEAAVAKVQDALKRTGRR